MASTGNISIIGGTAPTGLIPESSARATLGGLVRQILLLSAGQMAIFVGLRSRRVVSFSGLTESRADDIATAFAAGDGTDPFNFRDVFDQPAAPEFGMQLIADLVPTSVKSYTADGVTIVSSISGGQVNSATQPFADSVLKPSLRAWSIQGLIDALDDAHSVRMEADVDGWQGTPTDPTETIIFLSQGTNKVSVAPVVTLDPASLANGIASMDYPFYPFLFDPTTGLMRDCTLQVHAASIVASPTASDEFFEPGGLI